MGFIRKLFSSVSSVALLLAGTPGVKSNVPLRSDEAIRQGSGIVAGERDLLKEFIAATERPYTEQTVESGIRRMFDNMGSDRLQQLPAFSRNLHILGMSPENEVAAVETLLAMVDQSSGSTITDERAGRLSGQIFDHFVASVTVAQAAAAVAGEGPKGGDDPLRPGSPDPGTQADSGRPIQGTQLAQAGISSPEELELFLPVFALEELEQFEPAAGEQVAASLGGGNPFES